MKQFNRGMSRCLFTEDLLRVEDEYNYQMAQQLKLKANAPSEVPIGDQVKTLVKERNHEGYNKFLQTKSSD